MRAQAKLHVAHPHTSNTLSQPLHGTFDSPWRRWFAPRKETRPMSDEAQRTHGLFLPYPLLGILLTLVLALGGGIIGLYATVTTMNATMIMRDSDHRQKVEYLENRIGLLEMYVQDDRLKIKGQEKDIDNLQKRRN